MLGDTYCRGKCSKKTEGLQSGPAAISDEIWSQLQETLARHLLAYPEATVLHRELTRPSPSSRPVQILVLVLIAEQYITLCSDDLHTDKQVTGVPPILWTVSETGKRVARERYLRDSSTLGPLAAGTPQVQRLGNAPRGRRVGHLCADTDSVRIP
jgi:hypothetical protein